MKSFLLGALLVIVVVPGGCGLRQADAPQSNGEPEAQSGPIPVSTAVAVARQVPAYISATGGFIADESSDVAPEAPGQVVATPVNVGDFVRQGQVIARLDDRDAQLRLRQSVAAEHQAEAALRQAQARLGSRSGDAFNPNEVPEVRAAREQSEAAEAQARLAEKNAQRYANLVKTGDVASSVYDQARAQAETARAQANAARQQYEVAVNTAHQGNQGVAAAQAALEAARAQTALAREALDNTIVRSPFAGHVSDRPVAPGESVSTTTKVATIQRLNPIKLQLQLSETDAGRAQIGMAVTAKVAAHPQLEFTGRVTAINPALDLISHAITVEARLDNPRNLLLPGMFATARLLISGGERAVFVPRSAVINDPATNSSRVFVIEGNVARVRVTQTGETENDLIRITSGLEGGETVATSNLDQLFDGAVVTASGQ
ncbi:MAG: efflux RND transporter periplasmic adaptor subunit [Blastocatellia bacterium]